MTRKKQIVTAVLISGTLGWGAQPVFAQGGSSPGGATGPTGPTVPQPGPEVPRETQPTLPGKPAPGIPQTDPVPGQPRTMPGGPGTIPERMEQPGAATGHGTSQLSANDIKNAQEALRARGHNPGSMSGQMDAQTQQAIREFQNANNLPVTGVLDQRTAQQLGVRLERGQGPSVTPPNQSAPFGQPGRSDAVPAPGGTTR
ncbi:MAG TPA: peptidoglycan-binding protein [Candidatus Eisenbacteria bacterium]|nr:peptidoglycan-binding protein [Candidatus Eisenbacteria bacterium]